MMVSFVHFVQNVDTFLLLLFINYDGVCIVNNRNCVNISLRFDDKFPVEVKVFSKNVFLRRKICKKNIFFLKLLCCGYLIHWNRNTSKHSSLFQLISKYLVQLPFVAHSNSLIIIPIVTPLDDHHRIKKKQFFFN